MEEELKRKSIKGVGWSMVETVSTYAIKFIIGIILARLLLPSDFGLLAIMMIFISISDIFIDAGFSQAFIHKEKVDNNDANTIFICNIAVSIFFYLLLFFLAPCISSFYKNGSLTFMIRVLSIGILISSFNVVQNAIVRRDFLFRKRAQINVIAAIISGIVGILCAYIGLGIWSLIIQQLLSKSIVCILLYISLSWKISFTFSFKSAKELFSYGSWILFSNIISVIFNNLYRFTIGKIFSPSSLGYYERAHQFERIVADSSTTIVGRVAFPTFARLQNNIEGLKSSTFLFIKYSCVIVLPILASMCVLSRSFITILLTEKWLPCVPYLQLLCCVGALWPFFYFIGPLLQAKGETKTDSFLTFLLCILRLFNIIITFKYGVSGIIIGEFFCLLLYIIIASFVSKNKLEFNYLYVFVEVGRIILIFIAILLFGFLMVQAIYTRVNVYLEFFITLFFMIGLYSLLMLLFEKATMQKIIYYIFKKVK